MSVHSCNVKLKLERNNKQRTLDPISKEETRKIEVIYYISTEVY